MASEHSNHTEIDAAWRKARPIAGRDPALYRMAPDILQSVIRRDRFGICGNYGWRIEHGRPISWHEMSMEMAMRQVERDLVPAPTALRGNNSAR